MTPQDEISALKDRLAVAEALLREKADLDAALRESEARHRLLVATWAQAVWETDAAGVVTADSPSWRAYTGQTLEEWLGDGWFDAIHPDDRPYVERRWREAIAAREVVDVEFRLRRPDGSWRWTNVRAAPLLDAEGSIEKWIGINIDIERRKAAETAVQRSEEKYRTLFDTIDNGYALTDLLRDGNGRVVDVIGVDFNRNYTRHSGVVPFVGRRATDVIAMPDRWLEQYEEVARTGLPARHDNHIVVGDRWVSAHFSLVGERGSDRVAVVFDDITDRKRAEAQLRDSQERQAFLLKLSDALRAEPDVDAIATCAIRMLHEQMQLDRCYIATYRPDDDVADIGPQIGNDTVAPLPAEVRLSDFPDAYEQIREQTFVLADDLARPGLSDGERAASASLGMRAMVASTVRKGDKNPLTSLVAVSSRVRHWTPGDVALVEEAAERTWAAMEGARAVAALRASEERFRQFGDASQDILWIRDAATLQWQYLTPAFEQIYGLGREEALAGDNFRSWLDLIVPDDRPDASANIDRVRRGESVAFEYRVRRPVDGAIRWLRNTDFAIRDQHGAIALIGGIGHDLTELRETELRLQALIEGNPQLVWRAVDGGDWTWASPQWTAFTGQQEADSRGSGWLEPLHPDDRDAARDAWHQAVDRGGIDVEYRIRDQASCAYRWFQTRVTPVRDEAGSIIEWLGTSTDIHDLRLLQDRQQVMVQELQHRTRNLIAVVNALSRQTLNSATSLNDFDRHFQDRLSALSRVQGLLSHLSAGKRVTFDALLGSELAALGAPADKVTLDGPRGVPLKSATVQTFSLALHELATNALKYGALAVPGGHLTVRWRVTHADPGGPRLQVDWCEAGVDMTHVDDRPRQGGYGRELIELALPYQLGAKTSYTMAADGVHCTIDVPAAKAMAEPD